MDRVIFDFAAAVLLLGQMIACIYARRAWLRWLPFGVCLLLALLCFAAYAASRWTNWGFLILLALHSCILAGQGLILLVNWLVRRLRKNNLSCAVKILDTRKN